MYTISPTTLSCFSCFSCFSYFVRCSNFSHILANFLMCHKHFSVIKYEKYKILISVPAAGWVKWNLAQHTSGISDFCKRMFCSFFDELSNEFGWVSIFKGSICWKDILVIFTFIEFSRNFHNFQSYPSFISSYFDFRRIWVSPKYHKFMSYFSYLSCLSYFGRFPSFFKFFLQYFVSVFHSSLFSVFQ